MLDRVVGNLHVVRHLQLFQDARPVNSRPCKMLKNRMDIGFADILMS